MRCFLVLVTICCFRKVEVLKIIWNWIFFLIDFTSKSVLFSRLCKQTWVFCARISLNEYIFVVKRVHASKLERIFFSFLFTFFLTLFRNVHFDLSNRFIRFSESRYSTTKISGEGPLETVRRTSSLSDTWALYTFTVVCEK